MRRVVIIGGRRACAGGRRLCRHPGPAGRYTGRIPDRCRDARRRQPDDHRQRHAAAAEGGQCRRADLRRIKALHADFNDKVTEGQLLAELDELLAEAQLAQSEAELASAQAQLKLAQVSYERARNLAARGAGAKATFDEAAANLGSQRRPSGRAEARVEIDRVNLSYTVINSPVWVSLCRATSMSGRPWRRAVGAAALFDRAGPLAMGDRHDGRRGRCRRHQSRDAGDVPRRAPSPTAASQVR